MRPLLPFVALIACALLVRAVPAGAETCDNVRASCSVEDLGDDRYRATFVVTNGSPESNTIFKWRIDPPHIPLEWVSVSFEVPPDWVGDHPDHHLDFDTPNGDLRPNRIFSGAAGACGTDVLVFRWTFDDTDGSDGPDPLTLCTDVDLIDYTFHIQGIDPASCRNVGETFTCPGVVPVEPATWGAIKDTYRSAD